MKILIGYFYQIRFFQENYIPVSTCLSDPAWYHNNQDKKFQYYDKRNVYCGIRYEKLSPRDVHCEGGGCILCDHPRETDGNCEFLTKYTEYLHSLDFQDVINDFRKLERWWLTSHNEEPTIVLMCYEAYNNPCSEREPLIKWFRENGYELEKYYVK